MKNFIKIAEKISEAFTQAGYINREFQVLGESDLKNCDFVEIIVGRQVSLGSPHRTENGWKHIWENGQSEFIGETLVEAALWYGNLLGIISSPAWENSDEQ